MIDYLFSKNVNLVEPFLVVSFVNLFSLIFEDSVYSLAI